MTEPMTPERLAEIRQHDRDGFVLNWHDRHDLLAEVDRLRAQVTALIDAFTYERDGWRWTSFHADVDATPEIRAILADDYAKEER